MSRWVENFKDHVFQTTWENLKVTLRDITVDDDTIVTSVTELARLKKVVTYLDELLKSIDPELVPVATWDNCNAQATPCHQQITTFVNNRNIGHITNANNNADNLLTYIRPYIVTDAKAINAIQTAMLEYSKTVNDSCRSFVENADNFLNEINENKSATAEILSSIEESKNEVDKVATYLFGEDGAEKKIVSLVDDFEAMYLKINDFYTETLIGDEVEESTQKAILNAKKESIELQEAIQELLSEADPEIKELEKFHTKIFGKEDVLGERSIGLKEELDTRISALESFEGEQQTKYNTLVKQIEDLIPAATTTGLASAYATMKKSFNDQIKYASWLFYFSLFLLLAISLGMSIEGFSDSGVMFSRPNTLQDVLKGLVHKIPYYAPILWLAFYATKRRSECQRLQQEYSHKEALAVSYNSYKKQLRDLGDDDGVMQKELITKAIDAIVYNASKTLDGKHGDNMPMQQVIEKAVEAALKAKVL